MSYKYEASIKEAINIEYHTDFSGYMNRIKELDRVYAQAAKSDEYEAKAKAFDAIMREWEDERMTKAHILETIQKYYDEYESGESDA